MNCSSSVDVATSFASSSVTWKCRIRLTFKQFKLVLPGLAVQVALVGVVRTTLLMRKIVNSGRKDATQRGIGERGRGVLQGTHTQKKVRAVRGG